MKKIVLPLAAVFLLLGAMACNKKQKDATQKGLAMSSNKENEAFDFLEVGNGGGITGGGQVYRIAPNGGLQKYNRKTANSPADTVFLRTIPPKEIDKIVKAITDTKFTETVFNDPGNMSFFIRLSQEGQLHEVVWGRRANETPENIKQLYNTLGGVD